MQGKKRTITVTPNPAREGGTVTITGPAHSLVYIVYRKSVIRKKLGADGTLKYPVPGEGGDRFVVTDWKWPEPKAVEVKITSSQG